MFQASENAITRAAVKHAALSELDELCSLLHAELGASAQLSIEEIEAELREMGFDMSQPFPARTRRPHVYVSDEPLHNECTEEVKLLMRTIRSLGHQRRYEEALDIAREATKVAPNYWRAWISLGTLLGLFDQVNDAEKIFEQVTEDFADDLKAVAAGLHGSAWVKEIRIGFDPSVGQLQDTASLYEKSLQFDDTRANTRACLFINQVMTDETDKHTKLLEDSVLHEGFFEALRFELNERGTKMHKVLKALPTWLRYLLYPIRPLQAGGHSS